MIVIYKIIRYEEDGVPPLFTWKKGDIKDIRLVEIKAICCERMNEALEGNFIRFGSHDTWLNRNHNLNLLHCSPYPEGACWDTMAINYCPFCGEKFTRQGIEDTQGASTSSIAIIEE
jgi:hypothetical protein